MEVSRSVRILKASARRASSNLPFHGTRASLIQLLISLRKLGKKDGVDCIHLELALSNLCMVLKMMASHLPLTLQYSEVGMHPAAKA